jgi:hypothetical protein
MDDVLRGAGGESDGTDAGRSDHAAGKGAARRASERAGNRAGTTPAACDCATGACD